MRILVAGAAGYLGSILTPYLVRRKFGHVTAVDNFMRRVPSLIEVTHYRNFNIIREDVRNLATKPYLLKKFDTIIWLAAVVGAPACLRDEYAASGVNFSSVADLTQATSPDQAILFPCTNSGYDPLGGGARTEDDPMRPVTLYGRTKVDAEQLLLERENTISFRLATLFGMAPRMRTDLLINDFVYRATKDSALIVYQGGFRRNAVHVRDAARAFFHGIENFHRMRGEAYNVGLPEANLTKLQICERIKQHIPDFCYLEAPYKEDPDVRDFALDSTKLLATGFRYRHSLDDGIDELIKGYTMLEDRRFTNVT